ncbi:MAG: hypothetical protein ATN35_08045 [Epulopiscium sp. Nele67-Bin004]|nr:MAG: hypothetical protein ATN35_08045 [Epulopiscium sp. Nele67-Bin004]
MKDKIYIYLAIIINNIGDVIFDLAIMWNIVALTGDVMNSAYIMATSITFRAIISIFSGIIVDKFNKKKLVQLSIIASTIIISAFMICCNLYVNSIVTIGLVFILINDISNEVFRKSWVLMCAEKFKDNEYLKFQSILTISSRITIIFGSIVVGVMIDTLSLNTIFLFDIATYILCFVIFSLVSYQPITEVVANNSVKNIFVSVIDDIRYLFDYVKTSKYILSFIAIMMTLNLIYGYIPNQFPLYLATYAGSASYMSLIKSALMIGEIVGMALIVRYSSLVSQTFKIGMIGSAVVMFALIFAYEIEILVLLSFMLYGIFDSFTQPFFNYTVQQIEPQIRGRILGGIDSLILLTPGVGILIIGFLMQINIILGILFITAVFVLGYMLISLNPQMNKITISNEVKS